MCRKLILLTSFVLVVGFVNNANAADIVWSGLGADNLWSNPANWEGNKVPTAADDVAIEVPGAAAPNGPLIQDGIDAECGVLWNEVAGEPTMTMTGGTLTISGWGIWWGDGPGCNPTFNMSGGTVSLTGGPGIHEFGWGGANGTWIMTGGTVNAQGAMLSTDPGNTGELYLHGGTYNVGTARAGNDDRFGGGLVLNDGGLIDIGGGTLVLDILEGQESRYTQYIEDLMAAGQITAYGGAGKFEMDLDVRNPGMITATAVELKIAYNPDPADGAYHPYTEADLNWSSPDVAAWHNVYFGDNFDDVKNGTGGTSQGQQVETFFAVTDLVPGTTYYWRIDVVEADVTTIHEGDVWSFTIPPRTAYDPDPADGAESIDPNVELSWTAGFGAMLHTVYFGDNFDEVSSAAEGTPETPTTYSPGTLELEKVYYWRVDEYDLMDTYKGDVWSFTTPGAVGSPNPSNGATGVNMTATLSWNPGDSAASHQLYLGTDKDAVRNADIASPEYIGTMNLGSESYDRKLAWYTTYYWRVDEVNDVNPNSPWKGPVWSFTTGDFIVVDDFESYNDLEPNDPGSNRIFRTWIDGVDDPTGENGSVVGYAVSPFAEQSIVHGGSQSMPYSYDNDLKYSEASRLLNSQSDWTEEDVGVLSLWFCGDASNAAEQMYVAVSNAGGTPAVVSHDDPNAAQINIWTEWTIDLTDFNDQGVNLTDVNTIAIGFGDKNNLQAGGPGMMYFDDIRLYRPAPPEVPEGLVALWNFDEGSGTTAADSSGNGLDGAISGAAWVSPGSNGSTGSCLDFDGQGTNRVSVGTFDVTGDGLTIACWYKADNLDTPGNDPRLFSKTIGGSSQDHWFMISSSRVGSDKVLRFRLKTDGDTGELKADTATGQIDLDVWTHVAAVWDGATMRLYKNGVEVGSLDKGGTLSTNPDAKVSIGNQPEGIGDRPWDGLIDDVQLYNRGLSAAEIETVMTSSHLIAYWPLDEGAGNTAADIVGGHDGTLKGGVAWAGEGSPVNGDALSFDGYSDGVSHATDPGNINWVDVGTMDVTGGTGITLAAWIRPEGFGIGDARIVTKQKTWSSIDIWWMLSTYNPDGTGLRMRLKTDDGGADNGTTTLFSDGDIGYLEAGVWSHVAATYDGSKMRLYHNGVEIISMDKTGTIQTDPTAAVAIGNGPLGDPGGLRAPFHGLIDDVRIYNQALTQAGIETIKNGG